jgi:hypothetical protein
MEILEEKEKVRKSKEKVIEAINDMEVEDFSLFYEKIKSVLDNDQEEGPAIRPDSKIDARDWVMAYIKAEEEIKWIKEELIPELTKKYIEPSKSKIEKLKRAQEFIKDGIFDFLKSIGEKKISFPELATFSQAKVPAKIIYPDDENELVEKLVETESNFIKKSFSLDKKKILEHFRNTGEIPIDSLVAQEESTAIRVTLSKTRREDLDE